MQKYIFFKWVKKEQFLCLNKILHCKQIWNLKSKAKHSINKEYNGTPLQCSCLENPMDRGAWWASPWGYYESDRLSDFTVTFHFHALEKEMAAHSSVLAWRIPGMGEPGGLPSMGSHRVGHYWSDLAAEAAECRQVSCLTRAAQPGDHGLIHAQDMSGTQ